MSLYSNTLSAVWSQSRKMYGSSCPLNSGISTLKSPKLRSLGLWCRRNLCPSSPSLESLMGLLPSESSESWCLLELFELHKPFLFSSISCPSCFWTYFSWASTSAFSLKACSATCSGVRLEDIMAWEWRVGVLGRGGVGTVVQGGTVWPCWAAGKGWQELECGTVVRRWHGVPVLTFWLGTAGILWGWVFGLFCEFCVWGWV